MRAIDRILDRMILRRSDRRAFLDRRRFIRTPWFRVFLHRIDAPDPGPDLHDHPWSFVTVVLRGGYTEQRCPTRTAPLLAKIADQYPRCQPGHDEHRRPWRPRLMRLDEAHRIVRLHRTPTWTLIIAGPRRRRWGFYLPDGYMDESRYGPTGRRESVSVEFARTE